MHTHELEATDNLHLSAVNEDRLMIPQFSSPEVNNQIYGK